MKTQTVATGLPWQAVMLLCAAVSCYDPDEAPHDLGRDMLSQHWPDANGDAWGCAAVSDERGVVVRLARYEDYFRKGLNDEKFVEIPLPELKMWHASLTFWGDADALPVSKVLTGYAEALAASKADRTKFEGAVETGKLQKAEIKRLMGELDKAAKLIVKHEDTIEKLKAPKAPKAPKPAKK